MLKIREVSGEIKNDVETWQESHVPRKARKFKYITNGIACLVRCAVPESDLAGKENKSDRSN